MRRLLPALLLFAATAASARVISYAPYSDRITIPATQSRLNRHFVLLELSSEVGLARNGTLTTSPGPSRGPLLGLLGGGGAGAPRTQAGARVDPLLQLGVRVLLP